MKHYGTSILFRMTPLEPNQIQRYETRAVLVRARNLSSAERKLQRYISRFVHLPLIPSEFIRMLPPEEIDPELDGDVLEVDSAIHISDLSPKDFLATAWVEARPNNCTDRGWKHTAPPGDCLNCCLKRKKSPTKPHRLRR